MQIKALYISGKFTILIPVLEFLLVWIGLPILIFSFLRWQIAGWIIFLSFIATFVLALALSVLTYGFIRRLSRERYGTLSLENDVLIYQSGRRRGTIDLKTPHELLIYAGTSGTYEPAAQLYFRKVGLIIHLYGASREEVLSVFSEPYFVEELSILPEEGLWGFKLLADEPEHKRFFFALLESAWQNREKNECYKSFTHYPWHEKPKPAFKRIKVIKTDSMTAEEKEFIDQLLKQVVDKLEDSYIRATPDYLVGWAYKTLKSNWTGIPDYYFIMPIGHVQVEVSRPRPDWKPFIIGHIVVEALNTLGGSGGSHGGITLHDKRYLYVRGRGEDGKKLELAFDWYNLTDSLYEESKRFVQFANR
ncbi:MAG: hypothetical protein WHT65_08430 [Pseudothermotoga sp.]